jgi:tRNA-uridine 2-sulfurtransferase
MSTHGKVLVAMSGGVDSSVAAAMLHESGYEVVGLTMKTWDYANANSSKKETGCCSLDSINDARAVAVKFGFTHIVLDLREEFGDQVIDHFVDEYLAGRTPNPCILCNTYIKWSALLRRADKLDCQWIATGHYAQLRNENERFVISRGLDLAKDQSYVLWGVSQSCLGRTMLPVGSYQKTEIRRMAADYNLMHLAQKPDSYEICFIPDNDYRSFLHKKRPDAFEHLGEGNFTLSNGTVVGKHQGYPFFTVGQRKKIVAMGEPYYVLRIVPETNTVVIGKKDELLEHRLTASKVNLVKIDHLPEEFSALTQIRSNGVPFESVVRPLSEDSFEVIFDEPISAIAPGQAAVLYDGNDVIAGGWIDRKPIFLDN